jgi:serine/threonine protein kinase
MQHVDQLIAAAVQEQARRDLLAGETSRAAYSDEVLPGYTISVAVGYPSPLLPLVGVMPGSPTLKMLLLCLLGVGGFGSVWLAKPLDLEAWCRALGLPAGAQLPGQVAVKVPVTSVKARKRGWRPEDCDDWQLGGDDEKKRERGISREAEFMQLLGNVPYVADLLFPGRSTLWVPPTAGAVHEKFDLPVLVMEAAVLGSLYDALHSQRALAGCGMFKEGMPEAFGRYYVLHVLAAVAAQWAATGVVHRDLKAANLLHLVHEGRPLPKIADLGLATRATGAAGSVPPATQAGSRGHTSPEQILGLVQGHAVDVWAIGILLLELVWGGSPLQGRQQWARPGDASVDPAAATYLHEWLRGEHGNHQLSAGLCAYVAWLCQEEPTQRPTAFQALCHPYMAQ